MKKILFASALLIAAAFAPSADAADKWAVDQGNSELSFEATQLGATFKGVFSSFTADIAFSPDDLAGSSVTVEIDMSAVDTASSDRDTAIVGKDWFAVSEFPSSTFTASAFTHTGGSSYTADGELKIRDVALPVQLVFDLVIDGDTATMNGSADLLRTQFGVGQGEFKDTSMIADEVKVMVSLKAQRQ